MCGIFSIMPCGNLDAETQLKLKLLFIHLAVFNDSRGGHSWGVWGQRQERVAGLHHIGTTGAEQLRAFVNEWKPEINGNWIGGHTRFGTAGERSVVNSHPFEQPNITLAHNGVLTVHGTIEGTKHVVDSGQLCQYLNQTIDRNPDLPFEEQFKLGIADASGSIGLLMSRPNGELYAYASSQELNIAYASWGYAISSDDRHLEAALKLAGLEYFGVEAISEGMLMAPWYNMEDFHAPARVSYYKQRSWRDYQPSIPVLGGGQPSTTPFAGGYQTWKEREQTKSTPSGVGTAGIKFGEERSLMDLIAEEEMDGFRIIEGDLKDSDPMDDADTEFTDEDFHGDSCELCSALVGEGGGIVHDVTANTDWVACADCKRWIEAEQAEEDRAEFLSIHPQV